jgi:hypothetical protein
MNKTVMKKWVKALRTGKYKQGTSFLKLTDNRSNKTYYCCLGVLCELYNEESKKNKKKMLSEKTRIDVYGHVHSFNNQKKILPNKVMNWSGLLDGAGDFNEPCCSFNSLVAMNDEGCSFKKIAKTIEKEWENL